MEKQLLRKIERLRKKMITYSKTHNLADPGTVELSQQLDKLLNQHWRMTRYEQLKFW